MTAVSRHPSGQLVLLAFLLSAESQPYWFKMLAPSPCIYSDLCLKDVTETKEGIVLSVKQTKTLQFEDRILQIPVPRLGHPLCPLTHLLEKLDITDPISPLFAHRDRQHKV